MWPLHPGSLGRVHRTTAKSPAVLRHDLPGWFHVTHPDNVRSIVEHGLLVDPPQRVYASTDPFATLGGIYVSPERHLDNLIDRYCEMWGEIAILGLTLLAGTRFCIDEDILDEFGYADDAELQHYASLFELPAAARRAGDPKEAVAALLRKAFEATRGKGKSKYQRDRVALDRWSCRLARMLDQDQLDVFDLRVFDQPRIDDVVIRRCRF
jgi:hypothetical protein